MDLEERWCDVATVKYNDHATITVFRAAVCRVSDKKQIAVDDLPAGARQWVAEIVNTTKADIVEDSSIKNSTK